MARRQTSTAGQSSGARRKLAACLLGCILLIVAGVAPALAENRFALVIGNAAYATGRLANPRNDAEVIAKSLSDVGFSVTTVLDANHDTMRAAIVDFGRRLRASDGVGLFYFAGHGVQVDGENYLIPVGSDIKDASEVALAAINLSELLRAMEHGSTALTIAIIDACRDNPFLLAGRSLTRGLAAVQAPSGTLIAFATGPGQVALDGTGPNSPYSGALAAEIPSAGLPLEEIFRRTRRKVLEATANRQTPWEHSSLTAEFFFRPKVAEQEPAARAGERARVAGAATPDDAQATEIRDWEKIKTTADKAVLKRHIQRYPNGVFTELAAMKLAKLQAAETASEEDPWAWITTGAPVQVPKPGEAEKLYERAVKLEAARPSGGEPVASPAEVTALYKRAAELGLPAAMLALAKAYDTGSGVETSLAEAARWYGKAADRGNAAAQVALGTMYERGEGVAQNMNEAVRLYRRAADNGDAAGLTSLAYLSYQGVGVERNWQEARKLYTRAADKGSVRAMFNLALMLIRGEGGKLDTASAVRLLRAAADKGHAGAMRELAFLYDEGRGIGKDPRQAASYLIASYRAGNKDPRLDVRRRPDVWSFATKRAIQQQLKAEGLYEGPAIGWMNVATRRAIDGIAQN